MDEEQTVYLVVVKGDVDADKVKDALQETLYGLEVKGLVFPTTLEKLREEIEVAHFREQLENL